MTRILCSALLTLPVLLPEFLYSQSDFYRGKTIRIVHGRDAGGSGDLRVKALVPFLQKYIPGNPTKSEKERKVLAMFRNLRLTGSPFFASPRTPADRVEILKQAMTKSLNDPEFYKEHKKLVSEEPTPILPDENQRAIRELPRDAETIALFNKLAGPASLPAR